MLNSKVGLIAYWIEKEISEVEDRNEETIRNVMQGGKKNINRIKIRGTEKLQCTFVASRVTATQRS